MPEGTCEAGPAGVVGGITTILVMPVNVDAVIPVPWQLAQPLVMPEWLIAEFLNVAPFGTGVAAMLEPAPTWQASHEAVVGRCALGKPTIENPAAGIANDAAALPWHCVQLLVVLGAYRWMFASVGKAAKLVVVWQFWQVDVAATGMWLAGFELSAKSPTLKPWWQVEQSAPFGAIAVG